MPCLLLLLCDGMEFFVVKSSLGFTGIYRIKNWVKEQKFTFSLKKDLQGTSWVDLCETLCVVVLDHHIPRKWTEWLEKKIPPHTMYNNGSVVNVFVQLDVPELKGLF